MLKNLFKKKPKQPPPSNLLEAQQLPQRALQEVKINHELLFLNELERCLNRGCELSCLALVDGDDIEDTAKAVRQLIKIIQSIKVQKMESNELQAFYQNNKHIVSNHTSIIKGIEQMYEARITDIREEHSTTVQQKDSQIMSLKAQLDHKDEAKLQVQRECANIRAQYFESTQQIASLKLGHRQLEKQVNRLGKQLTICLSVHNNSSIESDSLSSKEPVALIFKSEVSPIILGFLTVKDIIPLSGLNRLVHHILENSVSTNRLLMRKSMEETRTWRRSVMREIKYFQSMVDSITDQSVQQSALKFVYFHQRPGDYILSSFNDFNQDEYKKQEPKQRKNSFFTSFLKGEKREDNKFSIKDLADPEYFKMVDTKIQDYFHGVLDMKNGKPLSQFKQAVLEQYEAMKTIVLNDNQVIKLYLSSKFLYLETQQLHKLSQYLFHLLVQASKQCQQTRSSCQDLVEKEESIKNALQIISAQKSRIQDQNWLLEYSLNKMRVSNQTTIKHLEQANTQLEAFKDANQKLRIQAASVAKKSDQQTRRIKALQKHLEGIRELIM